MKPVVLHARPKRKRHRLLKGVLVVLFATGLTTFAIHASDSFSLPEGGFLAAVGRSGPVEHCPKGMVYVPQSGGGFCIDQYEASPGEGCAHRTVGNQFDTEANLHNPLCMPVSVPDATPWVNVPEHEALALCAKAGKRLPTNGEWYRAALGTPEDAQGMASTCGLGQVRATAAERTGSHEGCVSSYGVYDMVGNVWEWVDAVSENGMYGTRLLPGEGFVSESDADGVPSSVATSSDRAYGNDYFFSDQSGVKGMFRGGFWAMGEKAGVFTVNATIPTSFVGNAVGFRCAREAQ